MYNSKTQPRELFCAPALGALVRAYAFGVPHSRFFCEPFLDLLRSWC